MFWHQLRFEWKLFWRNPASVFFSVGLPLVFLLLIGTVFGNSEIPDKTYGLLADQYLVPAIMTLGIVGAAFNNVAMTLVYQREQGVLKRMRGTPLPTSTFVLARGGATVVNSLMIAFVILLAGHLAYGIEVDATRLLGSVLITIIGAASFCALAFAMTIVIPNQTAATPITNMIVLPLYFISGVFGDAAALPETLYNIGRIFPISHLGACLFEIYSPQSSGLFPVDPVDFFVLLGWGVVGLLLAVWKFHWEPRESR